VEIRVYNRVDFGKMKSQLRAVSENTNKPIWLRFHQELRFNVSNDVKYMNDTINNALGLSPNLLGLTENEHRTSREEIRIQAGLSVGISTAHAHAYVYSPAS